MSRIVDAKPEENDDEYTVKVNLSSHDKRGRNTVTGDAVEPVPLGKTNVHCCHYNHQCAEGDGSDDATDVWVKAFTTDLETAQKDSDNDDPWSCSGNSCETRINSQGLLACVIQNTTGNTGTYQYDSIVVNGDGKVCDYSSNTTTETPGYATKNP